MVATASSELVAGNGVSVDPVDDDPIEDDPFDGRTVEDDPIEDDPADSGTVTGGVGDSAGDAATVGSDDAPTVPLPQAPTLTSRQPAASARESVLGVTVSTIRWPLLVVPRPSAPAPATSTP